MIQLPQDFTESIQRILPDTEYDTFIEALQQDHTVSFRPNSCKGFTASPHPSHSVPWYSHGYYLEDRPSFTFDPLFHAGGYYVQEASSMFVAQALKQTGNAHTVLDLCAAPGGKSTLLRELLDDQALLVSNEPVRQRANILAENMIKWGHERCVVTNNYPQDFSSVGGIFDVIVADVPCSGEGMFRKDNPALDLWSMENVRKCASRQREILTAIWPALKEGGYLIYSTCTYNTMEDEENVLFISQELGADIINIPVSPSWEITGNLLEGESFPVYHFFPHRTRGEGFFLALLRKNSGSSSPHIKTKTSGQYLQPRKEKEWISAGDMVYKEMGNTGYALHKEDVPLVEWLGRHLNIVTMGLPLYEKKGDKHIPHHALSLSRLLEEGAFPRKELTFPQAIEYLGCRTLTFENAPKGHVLVTYGQVPLGFSNNIGSRANNMYPQAWRIRSSHPPKEASPIVRKEQYSK